MHTRILTIVVVPTLVFFTAVFGLGPAYAEIAPQPDSDGGPLVACDDRSRIECLTVADCEWADGECVYVEPVADDGGLPDEDAGDAGEAPDVRTFFPGPDMFFLDCFPPNAFEDPDAALGADAADPEFSGGQVGCAQNPTTPLGDEWIMPLGIAILLLRVSMARRGRARRSENSR